MIRPDYKHCGGVTLIELMIVVGIVAILAAIAIPSYRQYVLRTNRAEAKAALLNIRVAQEKWFLQNNTYTTLANLNIAATTDGGHYDLTFSVAPSATAFTAKATAKGGQASDTASCRELTIDQSGNRGPSPDTDGCWRR